MDVNGKLAAASCNDEKDDEMIQILNIVEWDNDSCFLLALLLACLDFVSKFQKKRKKQITKFWHMHLDFVHYPNKAQYIFS